MNFLFQLLHSTLEFSFDTLKLFTWDISILFDRKTAKIAFNGVLYYIYFPVNISLNMSILFCYIYLVTILDKPQCTEQKNLNIGASNIAYFSILPVFPNVIFLI